MDDDAEFAVQAAIAQRSRWRIIRLLGEQGGMTAGRIAETLGLTLTNSSMQLAVLSGTGLVLSTREGRQVRYDLVRERLAEAGEVLRRLAAAPVSDA